MCQKKIPLIIFGREFSVYRFSNKHRLRIWSSYKHYQGSSNLKEQRLVAKENWIQRFKVSKRSSVGKSHKSQKKTSLLDCEKTERSVQTGLKLLKVSQTRLRFSYIKWGTKQKGIFGVGRTHLQQCYSQFLKHILAKNLTKSKNIL